MKKLIPLIALVVILVGLPAIVISDTSATDNSVLDNEVISSQPKACNSSASGTITITMYAVADE